MKHPLALLVLALAAAAPTLAGPLQRQDLPADTKWLVHLDAAAFLKTKLGDSLAKEQIEPKLAQGRADIKAWFDFDLDWRRISGITIFGTDYTAPKEERGVALIYTDLDIAKGLDGAIVKLEAAGSADSGSVKRLEAAPQALYQLNDVFAAVQKGQPVVLGKSREKVLRTRDVLSGKNPSLKSGQAFTKLPAPASGFFLLAAAEDFNESAAIPPQANVLKQADGLRFTLAEKDTNLVASLALLPKNEQVAQQIQQVAQGLIALGALSQGDNADLQRLVQAVRVQQADGLVTLDLSLPVNLIQQKIAEGTRKK
jgi:hypothetical protein